MITRGSQVYDRADRRHVGTVRSVTWVVFRKEGRASVRWNDTGWISNVPVSDLRLAKREDAPRLAFPMKPNCRGLR